MSDGQILGPSGAGVGLPGASTQFGTVPTNSGLNTYAGLPAAASSPVGTPVFTTDAGWVYSNGVAWLPITQVLGTVYTFGTLPSASLYPFYLAITTDQGVVFSNGSAWAIVSSATSLIAGVSTFATLPSAALNQYKIAITSDQGPVWSNGASWLLLYNQTSSSLAIANNPPLISGSNGTAYSLQLSATGGAPPYSWIKVSQFADTNTWTVSAGGILACAAPATSTLDNITVQVTDSAGSAVQKLLTVTIAASAGTPAATPTFSPVAGAYSATQLVAISCASSGVTIYYTTNGSTPTTSSPVYSTPLTVSISQTISAIAVGGAFTQSPIGSASYVISAVGFNPAFPRLAAMRFQQSNYTTAPYFNYPPYLAWIACRCIVGVGLNYTGNATNSFGAGGKNAWVSAQKAATLVPGGNRILQYTEPMTYFGTNPTGNSVRTNVGVLFSHIDANKWLYNVSFNASSYPGQPLYNGSQNGVGIPFPNISTYSPADSNGQQPEQFFATYTYQALIAGAGAYASGFTAQDAASSFDGTYHDDTWYTPDRPSTTSDGDIDRDGTTDTGIAAVYTNTGSAIDIKANNWRAGQAQFYSTMETLKPNFFRMANVDYSLHLLNHGITNNPTLVGAMNQVLDAAQLQSYLGWGFTEGSSATFATMVTGIQLMTNMCRTTGPQIACVDIAYLGGSGSSAFGTAPPGSAPLTWSGQEPVTYTPAYQGMRYYTSLILNVSNGAIMCDGTDTSGSQIVIDIDQNLQTYDEWGDYSQSGSCTCGYLGYPAPDSTGAIQTAAKYGNGIWERRFYNPTTKLYYRVACNPRGNGPQTYNPGITLWKLNGTQNPTYNSNTSFTTLAMADTDGGIFCESKQTGGGGGGGGNQSITQFLQSDVSTSATSTVVAMATTTSGDTIVILVYTNFTNMGATPVQDTQGNTYNLVQTAQSTAGPGNQKFRVYAAYNIVGGANTVTVNYATATVIRPALVLEVAACAAAPLDVSQNNDQASPGTGAGAVTTGTAVSNTKQPAFAIGFSVPIFQTTPPSAVAPYTSQGTFWSASGVTGRCEYLALSATGAQQATFTTTLGTTEHLSLLIVLDHV